MSFRRHSIEFVIKRSLLLAAVLGAPAWVRGEEPLEMVSEAFRASQGLISGVGKGVYRHYRTIGQEDWHLDRDADISTYFDSSKYHIEFVYHLDEVLNEQARRIIYDGRTIIGSSLKAKGEDRFRFKVEDEGDGLARPYSAGFPWDIAHLSGTVWNPEREIRDPTVQRLEVGITSQRDVSGAYVLSENNRVQVRFECSGRFGFNLTRRQLFNMGQPKPKRDVRLEWKQSPNGPWYVRSLDDVRVVHDARFGIMRVRDVLKYTEFEPNAKVDARRFMEAALADRLSR
jgi:hypothetical protein